VSIEIEEGWRFVSADFSVMAAGGTIATGGVMLVRDPVTKKAWHSLPDDIQDSDDGPDLYVSGRGKTIEEAIATANTAARMAGPIVAAAKEVTGALCQGWVPLLGASGV